MNFERCTFDPAFVMMVLQLLKGLDYQHPSAILDFLLKSVSDNGFYKHIYICIPSLSKNSLKIWIFMCEILSTLLYLNLLSLLCHGNIIGFHSVLGAFGCQEKSKQNITKRHLG